jgi:hypothetical protein
MTTSQFSRDSVVVARDGNISCDLAGEAAIVDFKSGLYYGLDEVAASVWKLIAAPRTINEICAALVAEYEVEPDICERDVVALLNALSDRGLVERCDVAAVR